MKTNIKHAIEQFTIQANLTADGAGHISIVLRSKEQMLENRPNEIELVRGKKGWTRLTQSPYYFQVSKLGGLDGLFIHKNDTEGEILNGLPGQAISSYHRVDYREYTDAELFELLEGMKEKGLKQLGTSGGWYQVNP